MELEQLNESIENLVWQWANPGNALEKEVIGLQTIFDSIPALVFCKDTNNTIIRVNQYFTEQTGLRKEELEGQTVFEVCHIEKLATKNWDDDKEILKTGKPKRDIIEPLITDNRRWLSTSKTPIYDKKGEPVGIAGFSFEITGQKKVEKEVLQLRKELAHSNRVTIMGELAASVVHEINQPLSAIRNNAQAALHLLQNPQTNMPDLKEILFDIIADNKRASDVILRVRDLYKKQDHKKVLLDLNELVQEVFAFLKNETITRNVSLKLLPDKTIPLVTADRVQLQQVIMNFILNSTEAMEEIMPIKREIAVSIHRAGEEKIGLSIRDYGRGIDKKNLLRIFEPFFTTKPGGIGMGLSISRSIIEDHGGEVWAENNENGGASFHFTIQVMGGEENGVS